MIVRIFRCRRAVIAPLVAIAAALILAPKAWAGDPVKPQHLDVFVLVDVSASMYVSPDQLQLYVTYRQMQGAPRGSDPQRQRWDAVRLLLDLLTVDDRVAIIPFNGQAPAAYAYPSQPARYVPGGLEAALKAPRQPGDPLGRQVEGFAHNRPGFPFDPNTDIGGTAIFKALNEAHKLAARGPRLTGRKPVVILLTDGDDTELDPRSRARVDGDDDAMLEVIRGQVAPDQVMPVYAIGLGGEVRDALLVRIARLTGGSYRKIGPAIALVPTFRDLIWSLKYCWIKTPGPEVRRSREQLEGILDLGVLSFHRAADDAFARETRRPSPASAVVGAEFGRFHGHRRLGNQGKDYLYEYFGPDSPDHAELLARFGAAIETDWRADPASDARAISFSKRTPRPLFTLSESTGAGGLDRLERLSIAVTFHPADPFRSEDFRLSYSLRPAGTDPDPNALRPMDPEGPIFRAEAVLPESKGGPTPRYTLRVEAEGLGDPDRKPLAGYRLVLPERTIEVRERLRLVAEPVAVKLSVDARRKTVRVRGIRSLVGEVKLSYHLNPPTRKGGSPIAAKSITVEPRAGSTTAGEVVLREGVAEIDLTLASGGDEPDRGADYEPGNLVFSAGKGLGVAMPDLRVPVHLQLLPAALKIAAPGSIRAVSGGVNPPPPMPLKVIEDGDTGLAARFKEVVVTLKKAEKSDFTFEPDELWIEPIGGASAKGGKATSLILPLGGEFAVRFSPTADPKHVGDHRYELTARLPGKDDRQAVPARAPVSVEYEYPRLEIVPETLPVLVPRGGKQRVQVRAFLRGGSGERRGVEFRPEATAPGVLSARITSDSATVVAGGDGTALTFEVMADADAPIGRHPLRGAVFAVEGAAKEAPFELVAVVDELRIEDPTLDLKDVRKPIPVELWMGASHTRRLVLGHRMPGPLPAAIAATVDPGDDSGAFLLPRRATLKLGTAGGETREVTVRFPAVNSVDPNRAYRVFMDLVPGPETGLPPRLVEFEVRYRAINDLRPASP